MCVFMSEWRPSARARLKTLPFTRCRRRSSCMWARTDSVSRPECGGGSAAAVVPHRRPTCSTGAAATTVVAAALRAPVRRDRDGGPDYGGTLPGVGATVLLPWSDPRPMTLKPLPLVQGRPQKGFPHTWRRALHNKWAPSRAPHPALVAPRAGRSQPPLGSSRNGNTRSFRVRKNIVSPYYYYNYFTSSGTNYSWKYAIPMARRHKRCQLRCNNTVILFINIRNVMRFTIIIVFVIVFLFPLHYSLI